MLFAARFWMFSSLSFFAALKILPLADATGLNYLTPVLVTVMAGWFLREQITWTRWVFVVVGFGGMLLILQPGSGMLQAASFFALGAAGLNATFQILTRKLAGDDLIALIFYPSLVGAVPMSLAVPLLPQRVLGSNVAGRAAIHRDRDFRLARPFPLHSGVPSEQRLQQLLLALTCSSYGQRSPGGWRFGTFPHRWALAGMIVIAASAVMLTWYERRRAGLNDGGPEAGEWLATPMMMCVPGAGLTEIKLDATPTGLATQVSQLGVGESTIISSGKGPPKTVIRTD